MSDPHDRETYTQSLEARCDALVAELARYDQKDRAKTAEINILVPENRALAAENAGLRRDAERYRWLRKSNAYMPEESGINGGDELDELCDDEIAALAEEPTT